MTTFLVAYGTGRGQTAKVAERVRAVLADRGHDVTVTDVADESDVAVEEFDAVLVGSPVDDRRHRPEVVEFVEANREALTRRPSAFFQLSFASALPSTLARKGARGFVDALVERTGWRPDRVGLFAGAVPYTEYDSLTRWLFSAFSRLTTGDTDTSRDYEYTDWDAVERFAADFAAFAEGYVSARAAESDADADGGGRARSLAKAGLLAGALGVAYWFAARRRPRSGW